MVKIEFYYKSADKDKTEAMREAIDIALFGTNVQCNFKNLPDHLILEDRKPCQKRAKFGIFAGFSETVNRVFHIIHRLIHT